MKNRPLKHKTTNAFQFKPFHERIAEVDVRRSALYYVEHENEALEENQSYFRQTVQKWCVLNLTGEYQQFQAPLRGIITLPQLLHKKEFVLEHLLGCLENATKLSLQALLEFVVVLAKDLREDFCPYFFRVLDKLIELLNTRDADQMEWTLLTLAFLFKILRGFLRKKLDLIFERVVELLDDAKPLHVTNFAAECFSFIARDARNKRELVYMITAAVNKNPSASMGCGRLLFEIMRGVNQQFHSCAGEFWRLLLLDIIAEETNATSGFTPKTLYDVLTQTVTDMLQCVGSAHLKPFWSAMYEAVDNLLANEGKIHNEPGLHYVLQLTGIAVEHQHGKYLDNSSTMIGKLVKVINRTDSELVLATVTKIATVMMLSRNLNITQLEASRLSKNIVAIGSRSRHVFEEFVLNVTDYAMFEILILPDFLKHFERNTDLESLQLLSKIVTKKSPLCRHGINLSNWKQFPIKLKCSKAREKLLKILKGGLLNANQAEFFMCLILLPHLVDFETNEEIDRALERDIDNVCSNLQKQYDDRHLFALSLMVESLVHLRGEKVGFFVNITKRLLSIITSNKRDRIISIISMCLVKINQENPQLLEEALFEAVHSHLREFLVSVHHQTRLLVVHIFTLFGHHDRLKIKNENQTIFDILYDIESIEPNIHTYREQVMLLKKLEFDTNLFQNMNDRAFRLDAMKFVLSMFSVNFKLLWEPACEVLQSYAEDFAVSDFWTIYKHQLEFALEYVTTSGAMDQAAKHEQCDFLQDVEKQFWCFNENTDYVNYRVQLLVTLSKFNRIFEAKNREIVESFFRFVQTEYRVKQTSIPETGEEGPKATQKILIAYLNIFAKIKNPKTIFKSDQLYEFFLELLMHRSYEVQKLALDCIFTYNNSTLLPYKTNLYRLSGEKTIKEEMQCFFKEVGDGENQLRCVILDEHRSMVVPLVMKIVHTKMVQKATPPELKNLLLRFVGNFREDEINIFISMSFEYFEKLMKSNALETYQCITASEKSFDDLPIYRIQVLMKLIDNIRDQFAGLKDESFVHYLLHIKLCMDSILLHMEHSKVKQLKSQALINMVEFFEHFDSYNWKEEELEAVFCIYVWPQLDKLKSDCIHSPTPLLRLFLAWSKNPRYYPLLVKSRPGSEFVADSTPLAQVINMLTEEKISDIICQEISKMIISMLTFDTSISASSEISALNIQPIDYDDIAEKKLNLGSYLLLPSFVNILSYVQRVMKRKRSINKDHLFILSRVAEYVQEEESCDALTKMLLPMTLKKISLPNVEADTIQQMHTALYSLMKLVPNPEKYLRQIGLLLERVKDIATRRIICQMVELLAEKSRTHEHAQCAAIIGDMNAMDKRWLDQPDYERRLKAFRAIDQLVEGENVIGMDLTLLFVHQCFHYLKTDKDLAIRDNANHYLRKIIITSIKKLWDSQKTDVQYLIERVVLAALMKGIKDKNDATRNESIQLLGELSRECAEHSIVFEDLHPFTSSQDREIDFFDNITHLQIHRHRRSMNRFCKVAQKLTKVPSTRTVVNFLLPIVSSYLCCDKYRKKSKLTEAAGNCVAVIARMLPWPSYKAVLKQYLNKMKQSIEYQKQLIKIVVSLLDNFHFDLSKADTSSLQNMDSIVQLSQLDDSETVIDNSANANGDDNEQNSGNQNQPIETEDCEEEGIDEQCDENLEIVSTITLKSQTILSKEKAEVVLKDISKILIPDLFSAINYKEAPDSIKLNERKERYKREKEEMLKIPIAIAIVKLLQKLPTRFMDLNLPKLLIKVINFLKSNLKQVRNIARETLKNMMLSIGPSFLRVTLENLSAVLRRGFQVHVLTVTVHTILDALKDQLSASIVDNILQLVLNMCINDIFGWLAEEKEVSAVASKTPEAKPSKKSFLALQILAKNMSEKATLDMIIPLKDIIAKTNSRKTVSKVEEALNKIAEGVCNNSNISIESMLIFVFGITSESIPDLVCGSRRATLSDKQKEKMKQKNPDIYLIPAEPKRRGAFNQITLVTSSKTNSHLFVEMGLEILHTLIKKNQVLSLDYEAFLEPLIPILIDSMCSNHVKVTVLGIKCISSVWASKLDLPSVEQNIGKIVDNLLKLLHKYATAFIGRNDDNFQLVKSSFKAIVTLLKFVKYFTISDDQLKVLLLYVEQDLYNPERQHMTLILLRSILGRKLIAAEMATIIKKVAELSITNENDKTREECRQVVLDYLMNYPLGSNVEHTVNFFVSQLDYEVLAGRESAVQMLLMAFKSFPNNVLHKKAAFLFLTIGIRLINEESSKCRALVAGCLETLLTRLDKPHLDEMFDLILVMLQDKKLSHRELAAQLVIRFVNVEKESFCSRVDTIFPALLFTITDVESESNGKFVRLKHIESSKKEDNSEIHRIKDHSLVQTLNAFNGIFEKCPDALASDKLNEMVDELSYNLQPLLTHDHQWVRFGALKVLGVILGSIDFDTVHKILSGEQCETNHQFIYSNPATEVRSLVLDMCTQLIPAETEEDTASIIAQNLLFVANILKTRPLETSNGDESAYEPTKKINLSWLVRRVRYVIQSEVAKAPKSITLRKHMFLWMEALVELLDDRTVLSLAPSLLSPAMRELSDTDHVDETLKQIVIQLGNQIKSKIGDEKYDQIRFEMQSKIQEKRHSRQRTIAMQKVNDPIQASKRKFADKNRKKEAKKRKLEDFRTRGKRITKAGAHTKRRRMEDLFQN